MNLIFRLNTIITSHQWRILLFTSLLTVVSLPTHSWGDDDASSGVSQTQDYRSKYDHYVILRVVKVNEAWMSYDSVNGGWPAAVRTKETEFLKFYEVAIWEEVNSVHLYAFDDTFNSMYQQYYDSDANEWKTRPPEERIAHREQFLVKKFTEIPQEDLPSQASAYLADAFVEFFAIINERHPNSGIGVMYSGHGSGSGGLFANAIWPNDAREILDSVTRSWGRKLDWLDLGGPCNEGQFEALINFAPFFRYIVASDLPNGGYSHDEWSWEAHKETKSDFIYPEVINDNIELLDVLTLRLNRVRIGYEYSLNNMIQNEVEQANYLYDSDTFLKFACLFESAIREDQTQGSAARVTLGNYNDVQTLLLSLGNDALIELYDEVFLHKINNRDFFQWNESEHVAVNGMGYSNYGGWSSKHIVTVKSSGEGSLSGNEFRTLDSSDTFVGVFPNGSSVKLEPIANPGYEFEKWMGSISGSLDPLVVEVTEDMEIELVFRESDTEVTPINESPIGITNSVRGTQDMVQTIVLSGTDPDGDALTYALASQPLHGTATLNGSTVTYTPSENYNGEDSFTFTVSDGTSISSPTAVSIDVLAFGRVLLDGDLTDGDQAERRAYGVAVGDLIELQVVVAGAPEIEGWSARLEFDPSQVGYETGSFAGSDFIANFFGLESLRESSIEFGGTSLGDGMNAGDGVLGTMRVTLLEGFVDSTELVISSVAFKEASGAEYELSVDSRFVLTSEMRTTQLVGDFDFDGQVGFFDFFLFADHFGATVLSAEQTMFDLNQDSVVDFFDFFIFADHFGESVAKLMVLAHELLGLPLAPTLETNYPNPFNSSTTLRYVLAGTEPVELSVYDVQGQLVRRLVQEVQSAGRHEITWSGVNETGHPVATGTYFARLQAGPFTQTRKVMLIK